MRKHCGIKIALGIRMTSSNGNIFRVTGLLCGEFTGHRWIPRTKASRPVTLRFDVFFDRHRLNKRLGGKQSWGWWFETPLRSLWRHCNDVDSENRVENSQVLVSNGVGILHNTKKILRDNKTRCIGLIARFPSRATVSSPYIMEYMILAAAALGYKTPLLLQVARHVFIGVLVVMCRFNLSFRYLQTFSMLFKPWLGLQHSAHIVLSPVCRNESGIVGFAVVARRNELRRFLVAQDVHAWPHVTVLCDIHDTLWNSMSC